MVTVGDAAAAGSASAKMKILLVDSETVGNTSCPAVDDALTAGPGFYCFYRHYPVCPPQS
jgi:hypothetical protein